MARATLRYPGQRRHGRGTSPPCASRRLSAPVGCTGALHTSTCPLNATHSSAVSPWAVLASIFVRTSVFPASTRPMCATDSSGVAQLYSPDKASSWATPQHPQQAVAECVADAWVAAAALLRQYPRELAASTQHHLHEVLRAASRRLPPGSRLDQGPVARLTLHHVRTAADVAPHTVSGQRGEQAAVAGPGPFIYSALAKRPSPHLGSTTAAAATWVVRETASVQIVLCNRSSQPLCLHRLQLQTRGAAFEPHALSLSLPGHGVEVAVVLTGTPLEAGALILTGCLMTCYGVSWSLPWEEPTHPHHHQHNHTLASAGSALPPPPVSHPSSSSASVANAAHLSPMTHVTVLPPMPLLSAHVAQWESAVLAAGQRVSVDVRIANVGSLPVTSLTAVPMPMASSRGAEGAGGNGNGSVGILGSAAGTASGPGAGMMTAAADGGGGGSGACVSVDVAAVVAALPLAPGESVTIPLHIRYVCV
jgi:hypothetical protein